MAMKRRTWWAFDIECAEWDKFVLGAAVSDDGRTLRFYSAQDVLDWYLSTGPDDIVLAHFGGRYDLLYLIDVVRLPWIGTVAGSGIVSARVKGFAEVRDTFRLFVMKLEEWTGKKSPTGLKCVGKPSCPPKCAGHCAISPDMAPEDMAKLMEYCINDCRILLDQYLADTARLHDWGFAIMDKSGTPRRTIGTVAWNTAMIQCDIDPNPLEWDEYTATRAGYFGGRCEAIRTRADYGERYDMNSAYPWALTLEVPDGIAEWRRTKEDATRGLAMQRPGIYTCRVRVPDARLALLPHRIEDRVLWATGIIEGSWSHLELDYAVSQGAEILEVKRAITYPHERAVYKPFMEWGYGLRERAAREGDEAMKKAIKWILNSLTGKLAQQPDTGTLHVRPENPKVCTCDNPRPRNGACGKCHAWRWIGAECFIANHRRIASNARPHHAATLTARPRIELHKRLDRAGDGAIYCDTDSCYTMKPDELDVDKFTLGKWKHEGGLRQWRCIAPKMYDYLDDKGNECDEKGNPYTKAKGIPRADRAAFEALMRGEFVTRSVGVDGIRSAMARHGKAFHAREVKRRARASRLIAGTRYVLPSGETMPLHVDGDGRYRWLDTDLDPLTVLPTLRNAVNKARKRSTSEIGEQDTSAFFLSLFNSETG